MKKTRIGLEGLIKKFHILGMAETILMYEGVYFFDKKAEMAFLFWRNFFFNVSHKRYYNRFAYYHEWRNAIKNGLKNK